MPRKRSAARVLGPYPKRDKWRLVVRDERGAESFVSYATKEEAERVKLALTGELRQRAPRTVAEALQAYELYLRDVKQNKPTSVRTTMIRLRTFFPDDELTLAEVTPRRAAAMYLNLTRAQAVDSQRNILAETRTFLKWCVRAQKWLATSPLADIEGVGKRKHGKPQLRIDEARRWLAIATQLATEGDAGAIAAMTTLLLGLRASEVVEREVRDLDDEGRLLWIPSSKTLAGRRRLEIPDSLQPHLRALTEAKLPGARLFGQHWRDWPRKQVQRICELAKVPMVCAHSMRGLHSTLAIEAGATAHVVAASLGHESITVTERSYIAPGTTQQADSRRVLRLLSGGKAKASTP
jgi:integrase